MPRANGRLAPMGATRQWVPRANGATPVLATHAYRARTSAHVPPDEMQFSSLNPLAAQRLK